MGDVTSLAFDYLDRLDRSKGSMVHVNQGKINKYGSKHGMRAKMDANWIPN